MRAPEDASAAVITGPAAMVQAAGHSQRDGAGLIDAVGADVCRWRVPGFALCRAW
jgi:hypothetical protein